MENVITKSPACRLEIPQYYFVDVYRIPPKLQKERILSGFTVEDLENKATEQSIAEALDNLTK